MLYVHNRGIHLGGKVCGQADRNDTGKEDSCKISVSRTIEVPAGSEAITEGQVVGNHLNFIGII